MLTPASPLPEAPEGGAPEVATHPRSPDAPGRARLPSPAHLDARPVRAGGLWLACRRAVVVVGALLAAAAPAAAQTFTRADTLRGTLTPERAWWEVRHYDLHVRVSPSDSTVRGSNTVDYEVVGPVRDMQIDLQRPLEVDSVVQAGELLAWEREGDAFFVDVPDDLRRGSRHEITVYYHGAPRVAANAPWDGGFVWATDPSGDPWVATANQGLGASVWWPTKDHQTAEPDSMRIRVTVPSSMVDVSNGRLVATEAHADGTTTHTWVVRNPINNYNVAVNAGGYVHFGDTLQGRDGTLDLDYWVLEPHLDEARRQFKQVKPMLRCFEGWFGPYPFYEDGYKLVETPHLGMEHQSAIAYGNGFRNGYLGRDLSGTGWGLTWDFIIVHESGHEWFGNNITTADVADMWVHEGFTNYSENLFVECLYGKEAGADYVIGTRSNVLHDRPVIGEYGVQHEGSSDMYYKGGNLLHTVRQIVDDDELWRSILTGLNETFRHSVVTSKQVEGYVARRAGLDLSRVFDQYLRHADIPTFRYRLRGDTLEYRWEADVEGFDIPVRVTVDQDRYAWVSPVTDEWRVLTVELDDPADFRVGRDFYVRTEQTGG